MQMLPPPLPPSAPPPSALSPRSDSNAEDSFVFRCQDARRLLRDAREGFLRGRRRHVGDVEEGGRWGKQRGGGGKCSGAIVIGHVGRSRRRYRVCIGVSVCIGVYRCVSVSVCQKDKNKKGDNNSDVLIGVSAPRRRQRRQRRHR